MEVGIKCSMELHKSTVGLSRNFLDSFSSYAREYHVEVGGV